ncbi:unnamed protein product, partial [Rotaria magnacalcarata]
MDQNSNNTPTYYLKSSAKKKNNWKRNQKRFEKNEQLRSQYPPFESSSHLNIIHLHYKSTIDTLNELISKAYKTKRYVVDTESQKGETERHGALIQIQFLYSSDQSTTILIEINYLPDKQSNLYKKIIELCEIIFNNGNEILAWGPLENEFTNFHHLDLIHIDKKIIPINVQSLFSSGKNIQITHPEMERRDETTADTSYYIYDTPGDNDDMNDEPQINDILFGSHHQTHVNSNELWSLQKAIETTFGKFLDKFETVNHWKCGLDLQLDTWKQKLFSKHHYDKTTEQQRRLSMIQYAVHDCAAVAELYFHRYPEKVNDHHIPKQTTTSTNIIKHLDDDLLEVSDDEIIQILMPRFDEPRPTPETQHDEMPTLTIGVTPEEMETFHLSDVQIEQQQQPQIITTLTKAERQRKKNIKLKWKQKHRPDFQNKIKRPIYYKYDYRKIRAQLTDDKIYTSHQITINRNLAEVVIGFKTKQEKEAAATKLKINYFSRTQYIERWGEPEAYVTASRQYVAQSNQWSLKELILQVIVQDSTDQQQFVEDDCTFAIRSLRLQGAKCRSNKLSLSSSISTELNLTLLKWIRATERKQTNAMITLPVYLNATRSELLFTIELEAADNSLNEFDFYER